VLHLICAGYSNKEIADLLALAEGTVKNHVSNLLLKLNARDRTRAALKALQQGHLGFEFANPDALTRFLVM
jgi:DNA-binding NarL/FixJ family response regulator